MKETYNWKSLFAGVVIILAGIALCIASAYTTAPWDNICLSIGCSLIASGLVILMHDFFIERKTISELNDWKLTKIYSTRAEKNADSDPQLDKARYVVDAIAFGLKAFRTKQTKRVEACLRRGVNFRIITMDPESQFVRQRELEENETEGQIKHTIEDLVTWANKLNDKGFKGRILVKGYNTMTLDFYWRVDDVIYVGPYWYNVSSQQTITYKFERDGKGFTTYSEYFESLWENESLCTFLTKETTLKGNRKVRR